ncbi:hypothetical protein, partial [Rhizobium leguminosarum]|uniref:hypothetical protein n=1 Tax=Rhizobium leguminosarum TaxID=384 RepID=UPI003F951DB4
LVGENADVAFLDVDLSLDDVQHQRFDVLRDAEVDFIDPWVVKEPYAGGATRVVMTRNPYFWQVDTEGNQLPYIDE